MYSTVSYAPLYMDKQVALIGSDDMACAAPPNWLRLPARFTWSRPDAGDLDSALGAGSKASRPVTLYEGWQPAAVEGDTYVRQIMRQLAVRRGAQPWTWTASLSNWASLPHTSWWRAGRAG